MLTARPTVAEPRRDKSDGVWIGRRCALVAGTDPSIRQLLRTVLEIGGFQVDEVANPAQIPATLSTAQRLPQVIVFDVLQPSSSDLQALSLLRCNQRLTSTPIILVSSFAEPREQGRFLQHGATAVLTKPFSAQHLLNLVDEIVTAS